MLGYPSDARRDLGGDRDGGGAEDEERRPPRVPTHLLRRHEQGGRENTQKFSFAILNCNIDRVIGKEKYKKLSSNSVQY